MSVEIQKENATLKIKILSQRLDGDNFIFSGLKQGEYFSYDIEVVEIDFDSVNYINSLGITELINIRRTYKDINDGKTSFRYINVEKKVNAILELVEIQKIAEIVTKD